MVLMRTTYAEEEGVGRGEGAIAEALNTLHYAC
jgi:hypothetical protein